MHKRGGKILIVLFFLCSFLWGFGWQVSYCSVDSVYNLTESRFDRFNVIGLDGIWEVYEGEILYQEDFESEDFHKSNYESQFVNLPSDYYTSFYGTIRDLHRPNYGTLKANVKVDSENIGRKLYLGNSLFNENVNIWVDGKLIVNTGIVADNIFDATKVNQPSSGYFYVTKDNFDIIIHYSHFFDVPSLTKGIVIGTKEAVEYAIILNMIIEIALISAILILILYHFMFYLKKERKVVTFYFFLYVILLLLRVLNLGSNSLQYLFNSLDFPLYIKISYGSFYLLMPMIAIFLLENGYLPYEAKSLRFMKIYALFLSIFIISVPFHSISNYVFPAAVVCIIWLIIYIRRFSEGLLLRKNSDIKRSDGFNKSQSRVNKVIVYGGFIIGIVFLVCDYLYQVCRIHNKFYLALGIIGFIIIESIVISKKYASAFDKISQLYVKNRTTTTALNHVKMELENLIESAGELTKEEQIELINQNEELKLFLDKTENVCLVVNAKLQVEQVFSESSKGDALIKENQSILSLYNNDKEHQLMVQSAIDNIFLCEHETKRQLYIELLPDEIFMIDRYYSVVYQFIKTRNVMIIELQDHSKYTQKLYKLEKEREDAYMLVRVMMEKTSFNYNLWRYNQFCRTTIYEILDSNDLYEEKIYQILMKIHTFKNIFAKYHLTSGSRILNYVERELLLLKEDPDFIEEDLKEIIEDYSLEKAFDYDLENIKNRLLLKHYKELVQYKNFNIKKVNLKTIIEENLLSIKDRGIAKYNCLGEVKIYGDDVSILYEDYYDFIESFQHIYNNIVDHGIEESRYRESIGKPPLGMIKIIINNLPKEVQIIIEDDGRGLDVNQIKNRIYVEELIGFDEIVHLSDEETYQYIFEKGFSTMNRLSDLSGKGVGLCAIKNATQKMGGVVRVESEIFKYTRFNMVVPKKSTMI